MQTAIFGISNSGLNTVVTLFVLALIVVWLALIVWTYFDASRRIEDPVLVTCATAASLFPYIGTFVYSILRPPEFLEDAKERELEIKAAELRVRPACRGPRCWRVREQPRRLSRPAATAQMFRSPATPGPRRRARTRSSSSPSRFRRRPPATAG